ncbi:MAG: serine/threonine protein kinase, partial [Planctomycetota bacterium]
TPYYMALEQLRDRQVSFASDVASLGYILIEMLTGRRIFDHCRSMQELIYAKSVLPERLDSILPAEVLRDSTLQQLCRKMIAIDPAERFPDADAAELDRHGAARFHRDLIVKNLSTEYDREIAHWIESLHEI